MKRCEGCPNPACLVFAVYPDGSQCEGYKRARAGLPPIPPPVNRVEAKPELPIYRQSPAARVQRRIAACAHRVRLPKEELQGCGCKFRCTAGRSDFADGKVSLECNRCEKERVRVAFWGTVFSPIGGTETWHEQVARHFDPKRIQILGYGVGGAPDIELARRRFAPYPVAVDTSGAVQLALDAEVVISWGVAPWRTFLPPDWPGKVVAVCHGDPHGPFAVTTMREAEPFADAMAAVSVPALAAIPERWRDSAWVIPNALELGEGPTAWERNRGASGRRVGYLGRYTSEKRPQLVARAARYLPDGYSVDLAGPPREWVDRCLIDDLGPPPRVPVRGLGGLAGESVREFLRGLGCLVVPSESEGFGFVIGEAWGAGVPVIATPRGLAELHPDCCSILPADPTPEEIARAAQSLWDDPEGTAEMVERARGVVREHYSPATWARAWEDRIIELARGPQPAGS